MEEIMATFILVCFLIYCYFSVVTKPVSKKLQKEIEKRNRNKDRINLWVEKHKAVARYNRKNNRTRSKGYGGKYRHNYDGY